MAGQPESLDSDEGLQRRRHRHWYDRLMMLADGVFAIAITFLAAEVAKPVGWTGDWASLWSGLAPQLDAYAMSFLVISIFWLAHRRFMAMILTVDAPVTVLTLVVLGLIALLPTATRLISVYSPYPIARLVYGVLVVSIGAALGVMWGYAALIAKLVSPEVGGALRWFLLLLIVLTPPLFLVLTMAIPAPPHGAIPLALVALFLIGWRMRLWTIRRLGGKPWTG
ncbi:MAG TPA: TMEM175 family protein [Caulobacteraceae bacterium]